MRHKLEESIEVKPFFDREQSAVFSAFLECLEIFFGALDDSQFLMCVVQGRGWR